MKKFVSILFICLFLTTVLLAITSCKNKINDTNTQDNSQNQTEMQIDSNNTEEITTTEESSLVEAVDYNGYEFTVLVPPLDNSGVLYNELSREEANGEILNDTIYARRIYIEQKYNITVKSIYAAGGFPEIAKNVKSGDDIYDFTIPGTVIALSLGAQGYLTNLHDVPHLDFDKPWWNKYSIEDTAIMGKNYFAIGKSNLISFDTAYLLLFNKDLFQDYGLQEPYDLVTVGDWTFDNMMKLCVNAYKDLNGNGITDKDDAFGFALNSAGALAFSYGTDNIFVKPDENGIPVISINERFLTFFQKVVDTVANDAGVMYGEIYGSEGRDAYLQKAFEENRLLLWETSVNRTYMLRNSEINFGVLPMPKIDSNQERYSSMTHPGASTTIAIPKTVSDLDRAGRIIEDIEYYSNLYVYPAYLETTVKTKYLRDEKSEQMLDIIISSQHFDLSLSEICSMPIDLRELLTTGSGNIVSFFESRMGKYESEIQKVVDAFIKNT